MAWHGIESNAKMIFAKQFYAWELWNGFALVGWLVGLLHSVSLKRNSSGSLQRSSFWYFDSWRYTDRRSMRTRSRFYQMNQHKSFIWAAAVAAHCNVCNIVTFPFVCSSFLFFFSSFLHFASRWLVEDYSTWNCRIIFRYTRMYILYTIYVQTASFGIWLSCDKGYFYEELRICNLEDWWPGLDRFSGSISPFHRVHI